ncbi:hypothetical protein NDU88_001402 [Pleurodeles waltl]|uniref:Uncharacterized protein n=1 Tax=Pleurodeles waltl TaxID=8319 RepID=A0AAV7R6Z7_PLEWA|nr:hypothetical protein NDU88_001402 [Pleurodeles waltl]
MELLAAIQGSRVALEGKIETVVVEVNLLRADLRKVSEKVKVAEGSIAKLQTEVGSLRKQMMQVSSTVGKLEARLEDAGGSSCRNNIRLLGFPERVERAMVEVFVESWIKDVLQPVGLSRVFVGKQAHSALVAPSRPGAPSRAIIARLLNYKYRDCILRAARESERAIFENCKISIYHDYMNKVQTSRKEFMEVKAKLPAMNIRYMLLYLAHLKVISGGKSHSFDRPEEVWRWLEMWDKAGPGRLERTGLTDHCPSGAASLDWRICKERQLEGTADQVLDIVASTRVEIQQNGTMAMVTPGLADGSMGTMVPGAEMIPVDTRPAFSLWNADAVLY